MPGLRVTPRLLTRLSREVGSTLTESVIVSERKEEIDAILTSSSNHHTAVPAHSGLGN